MAGPSSCAAGWGGRGHRSRDRPRVRERGRLLHYGTERSGDPGLVDAAHLRRFLAGAASRDPTPSGGVRKPAWGSGGTRRPLDRVGALSGTGLHRGEQGGPLRRRPAPSGPSHQPRRRRPLDGRDGPGDRRGRGAGAGPAAVSSPLARRQRGRAAAERRHAAELSARVLEWARDLHRAWLPVAAAQRGGGAHGAVAGGSLGARSGHGGCHLSDVVPRRCDGRSRGERSVRGPLRPGPGGRGAGDRGGRVGRRSCDPRSSTRCSWTVRSEARRRRTPGSRRRS